jgi:ATP-dependent DNA helicase RecG
MIERADLRFLLEELHNRPSRELESMILKFAPRPSNPDEFHRAVAQRAVELANVNGGTILVGIDHEERGAQAVTGCSGTDIEALRRAVYELTRPGIMVSAAEETFGERTLLVIEVPRGFPPHVLQGAREQDGEFKLQNAECRVQNARSEEDYSARLLPVGANGIDPLEVERLRNTLQARDKSSDLLRLDNNGLLKALGMLSADEASLSVAGLLLVGREDALRENLPSHEAIYLHMTRETEYDRRVDYHKPLLAILDDLTRQIEPHNRLFTLKVGLFHFEIPDYPTEVYREALLNAFMHRDYMRQNPVYVRLHSERLEISNPGSLAGGITPDNIMSHEPVTRNRRLAEVLQKLRLVERSGMGVRRMYTILLASGKEPPLYVATADDVRVLLRSGKTDEHFARFIAKRQRYGEEYSLGELMVLSYLKRNQEIDLAEASRILQRDPREAHELLGAMVERRVLEPFGQKKGRVYRLAKAIYVEIRQSVEYYLHRDTEAAYADAAITGYVRENGFITNQMVRTLLRVNRAQSAYILQKLVKAKKLKLTGQGNKSRYEAGT